MTPPEVSSEPRAPRVSFGPGRVSLSAWAAAALLACGGASAPAGYDGAPLEALLGVGGPPPPARDAGLLVLALEAGAAATEDVKIVRFQRSLLSGTVDRIGAADGDFTPDGKSDFAFDVTVEGTVTALVIASVDGRGGANGVFQADTLTARQYQPGELALAYQGGKTGGVAVFEGDTLVNASDGSIPPTALRSGVHTLTLFVAADPGARPGKALRVYALDGAGAVVRGPTLDR